MNTTMNTTPLSAPTTLDSAAPRPSGRAARRQLPVRDR